MNLGIGRMRGICDVVRSMLLVSWRYIFVVGGGALLVAV
jgi:hypothetical protein